MQFRERCDKYSGRTEKPSGEVLREIVIHQKLNKTARKRQSKLFAREPIHHRKTQAQKKERDTEEYCELVEQMTQKKRQQI